MSPGPMPHSELGEWQIDLCASHIAHNKHSVSKPGKCLLMKQSSTVWRRLWCLNMSESRGWLMTVLSQCLLFLGFDNARLSQPFNRTQNAWLNCWGDDRNGLKWRREEIAGAALENLTGVFKGIVIKGGAFCQNRALALKIQIVLMFSVHRL